jgi:hypothetical protein
MATEEGMSQASADALRVLLGQLNSLTKDYVEAVDKRTLISNEFNIAKAKVDSLNRQIKTVEQNIMGEKKIIDAGR